MSADLGSFVGVPYRLGGAARDGADCWGLVLLAYRELLGIELPAYNAELSGKRVPPRGYVRAWVGAEGMRAWREIERREARPFDVVVLTNLRPEDHMGVVCEDPLWLLTTTDTPCGAHRTRWGKGTHWGGRVNGVYRFEGSCARP